MRDPMPAGAVPIIGGQAGPVKTVGIRCQCGTHLAAEAPVNEVFAGGWSGIAMCPTCDSSLAIAVNVQLTHIVLARPDPDKLAAALAADRKKEMPC